MGDISYEITVFNNYRRNKIFKHNKFKNMNLINQIKNNTSFESYDNFIFYI